MSVVKKVCCRSVMETFSLRQKMRTVIGSARFSCLTDIQLLYRSAARLMRNQQPLAVETHRHMPQLHKSYGSAGKVKSVMQ